jgi:4-oxalocrotonate tautomerase
VPQVHVYMLRGRTTEQKRTLIEEFTRLMVDVAHADQEQVAVVLHEVEAENWGRGGVSMAQGPSETRSV